MDLYTFLIQLLNSVQYGLLLFLVASGLTLIFGIMGIINLAHGSFYMIGAYLAWSLAAACRQPVAGDRGRRRARRCAIGMLLEWLLISRLYHRDHLYQVLLTYGLILMFEETAQRHLGRRRARRGGARRPVRLDPADRHAVLPGVPAVDVGACASRSPSAMYWLIQKTRLGMMIRAGASNREMVQSLGINIELLYRAGVRARRGAGRVRRHDRRAGVLGVSRHGQPGADHLLRRGRDRRHRLGEGRAASRRC